MRDHGAPSKTLPSKVTRRVSTHRDVNPCIYVWSLDVTYNTTTAPHV